MLGVVVLHGAGILVGSWRRHENLVRAMVTDRKSGAPQDNIGPAVARRRAAADDGARLLDTAVAAAVDACTDQRRAGHRGPRR